MATVTQTIADFPGGSVALSWDDVTLVYSQIAWTVSQGTLTLSMSEPGKPTVTLAALTADGVRDLSPFGLTRGAAAKHSADGTTINVNWQP